MKHKIYLIMLLIVIALIFFFWPGHPPYEFLMKTLGIESSSQGSQEQLSSEKDDFGCFYSCEYFPDGSPRQMCEDWKAGKEVQWPPDCSVMQYGPCIQLCEAEKKRTVSVGERKQTFNTLPSLVQAEFASDVTEEDKGFVITGISGMDFYLQKWFGKSINQPAGLRVYGVKPTPMGSGAEVVIESGKMVILIAIKSDFWESMIEFNKYGGENRNHIPAHEYVHVYQFHNGCTTGVTRDNPAPRWFLEGEAEWLTFKVMHEAGLVPSFGFPEYSILPLAKQETGLLKSYEKIKEMHTIPRYALYTMAIDYLMKDKPIKALDDFCVNLADGKGMSMPKAFETAFGISLEKFYEDFEAYRKTW